jgi:cytochrome c biogenesis protein ResB
MTQDLVVFPPFSILALLFLLPVIGVVAMKGQAIEQCGGYPHSPSPTHLNSGCVRIFTYINSLLLFDLYQRTYPQSQ